MPKVYCQLWEESEQGWGVRPDGYSLHLTEADAQAFIDAYWKEQHKREPEVPHEYSRPCGDGHRATPYLAEVSRSVYKAVKESANGTRSYDRNAPEPLGTKA
jgi:hypothetical protein